MLSVRMNIASPYSLTTFESCGESSTPVAVTSRSRGLWIYFKTDAANSAVGFSLPFVTYNGTTSRRTFNIYLQGRIKH